MEDNSNNTTPTVMEGRPARVEQAISNAMEMVRAFSERDPHDGDAANPWKNPQAMLEQLDAARDEIVAAKVDEEESAPNNVDVEEHDFRAAYMDMVTNAFADVLEDMRNNGEEDLDVNALVDCLQSGLDFMSGEDKELFLLDEDDDMLEDGTPTPHEQRRLELGVC